jgi:hypothetical protein
MARDVTHLEFDLNSQEEIGKAITMLVKLTGYTASHCADMIFSQDPEAKTLLFSNQSGNGVAEGVTPTT